MRKYFIILSASLLFVACGNKTNESSADVDSTKVEQEKPDLVADTVLTSAAHYYADKVDDSQSHETLDKVKALIKKDMSDLSDKCDFVYYPFSGPDFLYPFTMFPNADTYLMFGLENTGKALTKQDPNSVNSYSRALNCFLRRSFFVTKSMKTDLASSDIDGVVPIISMLMAKKDCSIISVTNKMISDDSKIVDADNTVKHYKLVEIKFFANATPKHEQTLYFLSGNVGDDAIPANVVTCINNMLKGHNVVTFLKAASYMLRHTYFSKIRSTMTDNSMAILQDDSGIAYRYIKDWDITLYGEYVHPLAVFDADCYQLDLKALYEQSQPRPLDFNIGYDVPSNWMCARKK